MFNGRRQPSCDGTSRMTRECQVRFFEGLGVKFPGPTRQQRQFYDVGAKSAKPPKASGKADMVEPRGRSNRAALLEVRSDFDLL